MDGQIPLKNLELHVVFIHDCTYLKPFLYMLMCIYIYIIHIFINDGQLSIYIYIDRYVVYVLDTASADIYVFDI